MRQERLFIEQFLHVFVEVSNQWPTLQLVHIVGEVHYVQVYEHARQLGVAVDLR